jgi:DNA-binding MurR/RpiR family transcriptional regulator
MGASPHPSDVAAAPLLVRLRGIQPSLTPAEERVATRVLADPRLASDLTITELAHAASTSETTVLRLCKRLGVKGYPQLRLALAAESAMPREQRMTRSDIGADDTIDDIIGKVAAVNSGAVEETAQQLDRLALQAAADAVALAARVDVYAFGPSALVGMDLQQKLHRIGVVSFAWNDPHLALASAALLTRHDVAIGISHSGATAEVIEALGAAHQRRATTVALTNFPLSPLAGAADIVLTTAARETSLRSGATTSRIAALTVVDCLYVAVVHRDLPRARKTVADSRRAVAGHLVS